MQCGYLWHDIALSGLGVQGSVGMGILSPCLSSGLLNLRRQDRASSFTGPHWTHLAVGCHLTLAELGAAVLPSDYPQ